MLQAAADRRLQLANRLAAAIRDPRDPAPVTHAMADILRARIFAIACGYQDANDLGRLRTDPAFKLACGRLPDSGLDMCSQPTCSRLENLPDLRTVIRLGRVLVVAVELCRAAEKASRSTSTTRWMSFTAISSARSSTAITTSAASCRFTSMTPQRAAWSLQSCLRERRWPGKRSAVICAAASGIRVRWPATRIVIRDDSHYGRPEAMAWC